MKLLKYNSESYPIINISKINDNIYLSGIYPLMDFSENIKKHKIKYILSCVKRDGISIIHDSIIMNHPDITILYLRTMMLWNKIYGYEIKTRSR